MTVRSVVKSIKSSCKGRLRNLYAKYHGDSVFIEIPKTGSSTLREYLRRSAGLQILDCPSVMHGFSNRGFVSFGHIKYPMLKELGIVNSSFDARSHKFAAVRCPYDRFISIFFYFRKVGRLDFLNANDTTGDMMNRLLERLLQRKPLAALSARGLSQAEPQINWLIDHNGDFIVDEILRFDQLIQQFRDMLEKRYAISIEDTGLHLKPRRAEDSFTIRDLPDDVREKIEEVYKTDFLTLSNYWDN